jgi:DNA repair protein RadC
MCAPELRIVYTRRVEIAPALCERLITPASAAEELRARLQHEPVEVFGVLCLTTKKESGGYHEASRGCLDAALVHPREVFKAAVLLNAASVVVGHNHPSGDPQPSAEDMHLTQRLKVAGQVLGIELLDHIVVGHNGRYFSFREAGQL